MHHVWADRLRLHDDEGNVDDARRETLLERLSGTWLDEEEKRYTEPALELVVEGDPRSSASRSALLQSRPDVPYGGVTVIYGPGGIGKTFFLRRLARRLSRDALVDPTQGIPVFAALPLLLHEVALENWISHAGIRLPIADIQALLESGVIVPVLDALDELVRGQAREGSRQFLQHIKGVAEPEGRVVLSSRDYYLNLDPLIRDEIGGEATAELKMGYFSRSGRRRYVQMRTGLDERTAAKWAGQLEGQAQETLSGLSEADVESLIGHPLFLDAFCQLILEFPRERRAAEAEHFRFTSPDVFGEIVDKVLVREHEKVRAGWMAKFGDSLVPPWDDPFNPDLQRAVFRRLVLLAAADGGMEVIRREGENPRIRQLRHGVFLFTAGVPEANTSREAIKEITAGVLGSPELVAARPSDEADAVINEALDDFAGSIAQHTLADTRPDLPQDLVFATRHRAYFDYLLANELLERLQETIARSDPAAREAFIEWCLQHHIFERYDGAEAPFATCLDFALWHRTALSDAIGALERMFDSSDPADEVLASYVMSLGLAVAMRAGLLTGETVVGGWSFDPSERYQLELVDSIVPNITNVIVRECSFPQLAVKGIVLRNVVLEGSDLAGLEFADTTLSAVRFDEVAVGSLKLAGTVRMTDSFLGLTDFDPAQLVIDPAAVVVLRGTQVAPPLLRALEDAAHIRRESIELASCTEIETRIQESLSPGRVFVNKLLALVRKHGHQEFAVWEPKLRGLTKATANTFPKAVEVLQRHGAVRYMGEMISLTPQAEAHRFAGKMREGLRQYSDVADYWDPIVHDLDEVL